jgi:hypothetical protein
VSSRSCIELVEQIKQLVNRTDHAILFMVADSPKGLTDVEMVSNLSRESQLQLCLELMGKLIESGTVAEHIQKRIDELAREKSG